ncbi:MAG TPA: hypothetical protein VF338_00225 [Leptolinea sp.]
MNLLRAQFQRKFLFRCAAVILAGSVILAACTAPPSATTQIQPTASGTKTVTSDPTKTILSQVSPSRVTTNSISQPTNPPPNVTGTPTPAKVDIGNEPLRGSSCLSKDTGELVPTPINSNIRATRTPMPSPIPTKANGLSSLSARAGFGMANYSDPEFWATSLGAGWFISWRVLGRSPKQIPEHWQTIQVGKGCIYPSLNFIRWEAAKYPGNVWIVGNEPDVIWQDNVLPEEYAHLYHDAYQAIKNADPSSKVAVGAISQATPLRLAYLDRVLTEYRTKYGSAMPADWWTIHGYVLREQRNSWGVDIPPGFTEEKGMLWEVSDHGRLDLFKDLIIGFRKWMADHGYQNTPLALTEFGILMPPDYGYPLDQVAKYMQDTFHWLQNTQDLATGYPGDDHQLVQRWAWFSLNYDLYPAPNLADLKTNQLTLLGKTFRDYVLSFNP